MSDEVRGRKRTSVESKQEILWKKGTSSSDMSVYKSSAEVSVRAKGSKVLSVYNSSEEYFEYICDRCKTAGDHAEAQGFCTNCEEYLCCMCFRSHPRNKLSKYHILLDKDAMPRKTVSSCDGCRRVGDELEAVGYCQDCDEYLCDSCYKSHPRNKLSRNHVLVNKAHIFVQSDRAVTSAIAKMNINEECAGELKCKEEYTYLIDIGIKANTDENDCYIVGMALVSNSELILCDEHNNSLKLIDIENVTIKDVLGLEATPVGVTVISNDQVAVALGSRHQIHIITVSSGLSVVRTIKTNGLCVDVKHRSGKLYVSFKEPVKFQILQLTGTLIKTIKPDSEVLNHCNLPRYIAVSPDESLIYVSDWKTNKVFSMDMNGNMVYLYQGGELEKPKDVIISPFGSVYLCHKKQHILYKMTQDLSEAAVIIEKRDGLEYPEALSFNTDKQHLYISSASVQAKYANFIKVYVYH